MAKTCFPLLEQMRTDAAHRDAGLLREIENLKVMLGVASDEVSIAWDAVRTKEREKRALERAIVGPVPEQVRVELAQGAVRSMTRAIHDALIARNPADPHMINVSIPIDLRCSTPRTVAKDVMDQYLRHLEARAAVISLRAPRDFDGPVKGETEYVEHLRITIPAVSSERPIMHWLDPDKPTRTS